MKATLPLLLLLSATPGRSRPRTARPAPASAVWRGFAAQIALLFVFATPGFAELSAPIESHAESAKPAAIGSPAGGAGERSEPEGVHAAEPKPHAESAGTKPHAESAESAEPKPHAEPAESVPPGCRKAACGTAEPCRRAALQSSVTLSDGSVLKGALRRRFLPADTETLGRIRIDLSTVESISFTDSHAGSSAEGARNGRREVARGAAEPSRGATSPSRVAFKNGDRLTVRFPADLKPLPFDTVIGRVFLPLPAVSRLVLEPPPASPPNLSPLTPTLIYHCTFDSPSAIARPAAGPAGKFLSGSFVPGKNGRALRVEADTPAFESMLPKGFLGPEGTIEFWAKIEGDDPRYVDGGDPLFVSLYDERGAITLLQFAANNGFARGGLGGAFMSWPFGTIPHYSWSMEYRKVLGDNWADWHHYAMSWKAGGFGDGSFAKVFVDGRPQPVLGGVDDDKLPARLADYVNHAHELGIPWHTARAADRRRSKKPFLVDDLRIWSVAKTDFAVSNSSLVTRHSSLLYHCTFDDAAAIERPAAGPAGKFLGGEFVPGKVGNALFVKAGTHAAEVPFPTGLMQPQGCIEFWGKIPGATKETTYPDGGNPQFFAMGVGKWVNTFVKYTSNDGFGTGGLHADLPGSAYVSTLPSWSGSARYPDFLGDPSAWHHYALVWSDQGLDAASEALGRRVVSALYVDGQLVNPSYGHNGSDRAKFLAEFVNNPVVLAFPIVPDRQGEWQNRVDYLIDDFKIWNFPKTDAAPNPEPPKLLYHCTFDDAAAIERPAVGPNGHCLGGEFVPGKVGNALRTFADAPTAEVDFEPGTLGSRGTIEFWAKKERSGDGEFANSDGLQFFALWLYAMGETPPWCSTHFDFSPNDGMGMSGLCGMVNHCSWASNPSFGGNPYGLIRDSLTDWHHYAVAWDAEGLPGTKASDGGPAVVEVFLDGKPVPTQGRQTVSFGGKHLRAIPGRFAKLAFPTPSNGWGTSVGRIPFLIDEFKIWSEPKTVFDLP